MPGQPTKVYYIPGRFAVGAPLEDHEVESKSAAAELVATGAFALSAKEANAAAYTTPEATEADESNVVSGPPPAPEPEPTPPPEPQE